MGSWASLMSVPYLGSHRLNEKVSLTFDFMVFEIVMCMILYLIVRGILLMKVLMLEEANEEANQFYENFSKESYSAPQNMCLQRCLDMSEAALNEYDSLLVYFGHLQRLPSRKICLQRLPRDPQLLRSPSVEESLNHQKTSALRVEESLIFPRELTTPIGIFSGIAS